MREEIAASLLALNRKFYADFGRAFASTRRRIQPGVRRVLSRLPQLVPDFDASSWLDLGCGNGALAVAWVTEDFKACYTGMDFSAELLAEAEAALEGLSDGKERLRFFQGDLSEPGWCTSLAGEVFDGALAFAVLHHIAGYGLRKRVMGQVHDLLTPEGWFIHSEWQFQHSPRWLDRRLPWSMIGLSEADLEEGDTLLDWRHALPEQEEQVGLRYVHLFTGEELRDLAADSGFTIVDEFSSDGKEGKLGLYQVWKKR